MNVPSLWDVEDVEMMPAVRDMTVGPASLADVHEFARRYHYTGVGVCNGSWRWGLWHGPTLIGVIAYNLPNRSVCASVLGPEHLHRIWHMSRLAMAESAPRNSESRLIGGSLRAINRMYPDVWAILTYAATDVGHIGYVYQATNALYTGMSDGRSVRYYTDQDGRRRATHRTGKFVNAARAAELGWQLHQGGRKHRYVYILGGKTQRRHRLALLRLPVLPYPKQDGTLSMREHVRCPTCDGCLACGLHAAGVTCSGTLSTPLRGSRADEPLTDDQVAEKGEPDG
jgi:hypothetical protein